MFISSNSPFPVKQKATLENDQILLKIDLVNPFGPQ